MSAGGNVAITTCDMEKKYFVTYAVNEYGGLAVGSMNITTLEVKVKNMSPGKLAEYLEEEVTRNLNLERYQIATILNYWEM